MAGEPAVVPGACRQQKVSAGGSCRGGEKRSPGGGIHSRQLPLPRQAKAHRSGAAASIRSSNGTFFRGAQVHRFAGRVNRWRRSPGPGCPAASLADRQRALCALKSPAHAVSSPARQDCAGAASQRLSSVAGVALTSPGGGSAAHRMLVGARRCTSSGGRPARPGRITRRYAVAVAHNDAGARFGDQASAKLVKPGGHVLGDDRPGPMRQRAEQHL